MRNLRMIRLYCGDHDHIRLLAWFGTENRAAYHHDTFTSLNLEKFHKLGIKMFNKILNNSYGNTPWDKLTWIWS